MLLWASRAFLSIVVGLALLSCAAPTPRGQRATGGDTSPRAAGPKRITVAMQGELINLRSQVMTVTPGLIEVEQVVNAGLAAIDDLGNLHGRLAETVPTVDNGLWRLFPDGRMETTWVIREQARWHDGTPFTSDDVHFTVMQVGKDRELPAYRHLVYDSIESIETPDPRTAVVRWSKVNIDADKLLSTVGAAWPMPMPKHLLQRPFAEDKVNFMQIPYWTLDFVGSGPYKIRDWVIGSHVILQANPDYVLGRPRLDEIELRFIPDLNALVANIVAGSVDVTVGRGLSLEQAFDIRELWQQGQMNIPPRSVIVIYPQLINPNPAVMSDVRYRRAVLHAIDRQGLIDALMRGQSSIAHVFLNPNEPEYREIESSIVRYEYDPRMAGQLFEQLGYSKGSDGMYTRPGGAPLSAHFQTVNLDVQQKALLSIGDNLKRAGVSVETEVLTPQRVDDREYRATRPGFELTRTSNELSAFLSRNHGSQTPLAEDNYRRYTNKSRYINAELDGLIDSYFASIVPSERNQYLARAINHQTEALVYLGLFYDVEPMAIANRVANVRGRKAELSSPVWNVHEWDIG